MKTALIAGSTGLIGNQLLQLLLQSPHYDHIKAITRKPLHIQHDKLENVTVDFEQLASYKEQLTADAIFCCLGTTMKQAGSKEAFRKVDYEYPLALAQLGKANGTKQYLLVSALGASAQSSIFYNRVKGETEEAIRSVGFDTFHVVRPSLLLGARTEHRPGERAAITTYFIFGFLIPKKYKAIESAKVARALLFYAQQQKPGVFVHESIDMQAF
jgi:uncharacterized protein YbjT (DUF2867 family)